MNKAHSKLQSGFTLVELIIVIVILAILAVTALPKFLTVSEDAQLNIVKSIAASFEEGVSNVQLKWVIAGEPSNTNNQTGPEVVYDGTTVTVDEATGFPVGSTGRDTGVTLNNSTDCLTVFNSILSTDLEIVDRTNNSTPSATDRLEYDFLVTRTNDNTNGDVCNYYYIDSLSQSDTNPRDNRVPTEHLGFTYNALSGEVAVFNFN